MAEEKSRNVVASSGYNCYSDASSSGLSQFQSFEAPPAEMYNMIGFPSKNLLQGETPLWKGFSEMSEPPTSTDFYHDFNKKHDLSLISGTSSSTMMDSWNHPHQQSQQHYEDDDPSSMGAGIFTLQGVNQRPTQGLSLSLSSSNPSTIALQSFGPPSSSRSVNLHEYSHITNSRYLTPAQELLNEFCNIGGTPDKHKPQQDENALKKESQLLSLDLLDLQRRKTKLLQMLEEVDRRYKHYCNQMKSVTSSFESVAGNGAATVYSALASRAMSRHFRCLKDGIVEQIKVTKKAMGEKEVGAPGTVKGETPRLRLLDQTLRQQKALQQMSLMETHPWRPQRGLPERSVSVLRAWLFEHFLHPYPSDVDKHILARQTGLSRSQVSNWFINARVRLWKPMVEEMYIEELKENEDGGPTETHEQKPSHDQLLRIDSECLSSIINNPDKNEAINHQNSYGGMELDFGGGGAQNYGGGVSLTLGLHQHGGSGGVSLAFTTAAQSSLFYPRDQIEEDCQTGPYSLLDNDQSQTLPYRNLMGAQLLRDLAG